jgi:hypothetical protein
MLLLSRLSKKTNIGLFLFAALFLFAGCKVYKFVDVAIPQDIKTIKINFIENKAPYINPQLSQRVTDRLRQKVLSQTRLSQTNADNADWEINGEIRDYSFSTSGISNQQTTNSRITVSIHITVNDHKNGKTDEYDVSRNFEFDSKLSLQQAEAALADNMIRDLTDDMFNRIFSNW